MNIPEGLTYTRSHEWLRFADRRVYVGITDHAQDSLGDIVYVDLPETNVEVSLGDEIATIESVKAAEPIFAPLSGTIVEVNNDLVETPEKINEDPYATHIFVMEFSDENEKKTLLDHLGYAKAIEENGD